MKFTEIYLGQVGMEGFPRNARNELDTPTATLHKDGIWKFRDSWASPAQLMVDRLSSPLTRSSVSSKVALADIDGSRRVGSSAE